MTIFEWCLVEKDLLSDMFDSVQRHSTVGTLRYNQPHWHNGGLMA